MRVYRPRPKELGHETKVFQGAFDAAVQYSQIEDVLASGNSRGLHRGTERFGPHRWGV